MCFRFLRATVFASFASLIPILLTALSAGQQQPTTKPGAHNSSPRHITPSVPQEQYISYWTAETGWRTELQLRNNDPKNDLTVTPSLRTSSGAETALHPVTVKPSDVASVDLSDALIKSAPALSGAYGSVVLRFTATGARALYAAAMIRMDGQPIAYHLDASFWVGDPTDGGRGGIWWLPTNSVKDYLVLTNFEASGIAAKLHLFDANGTGWSEPLILAPAQTLRLSVRSLMQQAGFTGDYGSIKIELAKPARLGSAHVLFDETAGFSALMKMFGYDPTATFFSRSFGGVKQWTIRAPMLALTTPDPALSFPVGTTLEPRVFIHNTSAKTYTAHIRFNWRSATQTGKTAPIDLAMNPNQTRLLDVASLQSQKIIPPDARWAAVIVSAPVNPDELLAVAASYDQTLRYGVQTPFDDQLAGHWEAGKWEVDSTHDSLVTVGNGGNKTVHAELTILYNHGTQRYRIEQVLAPDEQMLVDFGKLIRTQATDSNGHTLAPDAMEGTYTVKDLTDPFLGNLYEGKVITETNFGHAAYGCATCCGFQTPYMQYDPLGVPVSSFTDQVVLAQNACFPSQPPYDLTGNMTSWRTGDTAIATATMYQINGISAGTTEHYAQGEYTSGDQHAIDGKCPMSYAFPQAGTNVCNFTVGPATVYANNCTGQSQNSNNFSATLASACGLADSVKSKCSATYVSGNIDFVGNATCVFNLGPPSATVTYFAGPKLANGSAGTFDMNFDLYFDSLRTDIARYVTATVQCP